VKEYWIVDPATKESIGYRLKENKYQEILRSTGSISSELLNNTFEF
jgi:Uma2 family endonuclease